MEQVGERFRNAANELIAEGERRMVENSANEGRVYHTQEHPDALFERAGPLFEALGATKKQKIIARLAIAWHDVIISITPADPNDVTAMIKRHRGAEKGDDPAGAEGNEAKSAEDMEAEMRRINAEAIGRGEEAIFSEEDIQTGVLAVKATYPAVDFGKDFKGAAFKEYDFYQQAVERNPKIGEIVAGLESQGVAKGPLFFQPHLEEPLERGEKIPPEVLVMVLDDLGNSGISSVEGFGVEGDMEFRELRPNIAGNMERLLTGDEAADESDREKSAVVMLEWLQSQTGFVTFQMLRIEKIFALLYENGQIDDEKEASLRSVLSQFENNINGALARAKSAEDEYKRIKETEGSKEAFRYLAAELHYELEEANTVSS